MMLDRVIKVLRLRQSLHNSFLIDTIRIKSSKLSFLLYSSGNRGYFSYSVISCFNTNTETIVNKVTRSSFSSLPDHSTNSLSGELDLVTFEKISNETLESLSDYFDELIEEATHLNDADVSYRDGVLTVKFGNGYGTYVINRQTPNRQIWLSSPMSGPKRYNFINGKWVYKHDGMSIHELLNNEIPSITENKVSFDKCSYSGS